MNSSERDAEHERLRSAVVDAAKGHHSPAADDRWAESRLHDAVRALEDFENKYHLVMKGD